MAAIQLKAIIATDIFTVHSNQNHGHQGWWRMVEDSMDGQKLPRWQRVVKHSMDGRGLFQYVEICEHREISHEIDPEADGYKFARIEEDKAIYLSLFQKT